MKSSMTPAYGWGPIGERVAESGPHGHRETTTFLAAGRSAGPVAPLVIDAALSGELSRAYVRPHPAPAVRPGDLAVMGDLPSHQVAGVAEAVRGAGAEPVYLPPYGPDLNPIEQVFAEAKAEIRRPKPRAVAATEALCGEAIDGLPSSECQRYIRHAGYGPQGSG